MDRPEMFRRLTPTRIGRAQPARSGRVDLPVFGGSGLQPGVDFEDKESMAALLGEDTAADAAR